MATSPALRFEAKGEGVLVGECAAFLPLQHVQDMPAGEASHLLEVLHRYERREQFTLRSMMNSSWRSATRFRMSPMR
jgi:hypothetical protein